MKTTTPSVPYYLGDLIICHNLLQDLIICPILDEEKQRRWGGGAAGDSEQTTGGTARISDHKHQNQSR
jgi:hypothetical protein